MIPQRLNGVNCPICESAGRAGRCNYILSQYIDLPIVKDAEHGKALYKEIKPYIIQCDACEAEVFADIFPQ